MANLNQYTTNNFWKFGALKKLYILGALGESLFGYT